MHESHESTNNRFTAICSVIERSRFATSSARLSEADLGKTARSWDDVIKEIPTSQIEALYQEAMRERDVRGPFLPQELLTVYRAKRRAPAKSLDVCGLCDGSGWQVFANFCPTLKREREAARPCGCSSAHSSRSPLLPPDWMRRPDGVWAPVDNSAGLLCTCLACERTGKVSRLSFRYDSHDFDEPPCIR